MKLDHKTAVPHTVQFNGPLKAFHVNARGKGLSLDFIIMADNADSAICAVKSNVVAVVGEVRKRCSPADFVPHNLFQEPSIRDTQQANVLMEEIQQAQEKLLTAEDRTDEMAEVLRETLTANITANREKVRELLTPKMTDTKESRFCQMISRMTDLLGMTFTANELDQNRAYPVSYFDDCRSVVNFTP